VNRNNVKFLFLLDPSPHQLPGVPPRDANTMRLPTIPTFPDVPGLPSIPADSIGVGGGGGEDVDFDDLTRRFEELKRRK